MITIGVYREESVVSGKGESYFGRRTPLRDQVTVPDPPTNDELAKHGWTPTSPYQPPLDDLDMIKAAIEEIVSEYDGEDLTLVIHIPDRYS